MKNIALIGILVIGSCVSPCQRTKAPEQPVVSSVPDLQNDVSLQEECASMFREIIQVQDRREEKRMEFEKVRLAFNDGQLGKKKFSAASRGWLEQENALAGRAATLYREGRGKGCFQKVTP